MGALIARDFLRRRSLNSFAAELIVQAGFDGPLIILVEILRAAAQDIIEEEDSLDPDRERLRTWLRRQR